MLNLLFKFYFIQFYYISQHNYCTKRVLVRALFGPHKTLKPRSFQEVHSLDPCHCNPLRGPGSHAIMTLCPGSLLTQLRSIHSIGFHIVQEFFYNSQIGSRPKSLNGTPYLRNNNFLQLKSWCFCHFGRSEIKNDLQNSWSFVHKMSMTNQSQSDK